MAGQTKNKNIHTYFRQIYGAYQISRQPINQGKYEAEHSNIYKL
jgi:hypothetical protein